MNIKINKQIQEFQVKYLSFSIDKIELERVADSIFRTLFPICGTLSNEECGYSLDKVEQVLLKNIVTLQQIEDPQKKVRIFIEKLPEIQQELYNDAKSFYENDPAATSIEEIILSYPGFYAVAIYRLSNILYNLNIPIIPRLWSEYAHSKAGIDIHPGATIGKRFFLDHGTGVVIGETCTIGDDVKVYQSVTLGALYVNKDMRNKKRHPTIGNNVIIYSGATILGGETIIGENSIIGGNVWLTKSIESESIVYYESKMKHKISKNNTNEPINFII